MTLVKKISPKTSCIFTVFFSLFLLCSIFSTALFAEDPIEHHTRSIMIDPRDPDAFFNRGYARLSRGFYKEAIDDFDQAIRLSPEEALTFFFRGKAYMQLNNNRAAINDFTKTISLNPRHSSSYFERAKTRIIIKEFHAAMKDLNKFISLSPENSRAYAWRARVHKIRGAHREAARDYQKAIDLDDSYAWTFNEFAWMLLTTNEESIKDLHKAYDLAQKANMLEVNPAYMDTLACIMSELGKFSEAVNIEKKAFVETGSETYNHRINIFSNNISYLEWKKREDSEASAKQEKIEQERRQRELIWQKIVQDNEKIRQKTQ